LFDSSTAVAAFVAACHSLHRSADTISDAAADHLHVGPDTVDWSTAEHAARLALALEEMAAEVLSFGGVR
jgi:hypothetical protein